MHCCLMYSYIDSFRKKSFIITVQKFQLVSKLTVPLCPATPYDQQMTHTAVCTPLLSHVTLQNK